VQAQYAQHIEPCTNRYTGLAFLDVVQGGAINARTLSYLQGCQVTPFARKLDLLAYLTQHLLVAGKEDLLFAVHVC